MNFLEAVKVMKRGKKVRRKGWDTYMFLDQDRIMEMVGGKPKFVFADSFLVLGTDWEIVEEKTTLSDRIIIIKPVKFEGIYETLLKNPMLTYFMNGKYEY